MTTEQNFAWNLMRAGRHALDHPAPGVLCEPMPEDASSVRLMPFVDDYRTSFIDRFEFLPRLAGTTSLFNLAATYADAEVEKAILANKHWEIQGTNAANAGVAFSTIGGFTMTTAGGAADSMILAPLQEATVKADGGAEATYDSIVNKVPWATTKKPYFRAFIRTGNHASKPVVWAGWKLTNTPVIATDNDQAFFRAEEDGSGGVWQIVTSANGVDTTTDTEIPFEANTNYLLEIFVDGSRYPHYYINGRYCGKGPRLKNAVTTLKPFVGILASGTAEAAVLTVKYVYLSQDIN